MDKMAFEDSEKTFKDLEKITDKDANARLKFFYIGIISEYQIIILMKVILNMRMLMNKKF